MQCALDDRRLKEAGGGNYFDELLARIRDIRSSEKLFWSKVLDIYATSVDYDPRVEVSKRFFAVVQNKMHWAAHGHIITLYLDFAELQALNRRQMSMADWVAKLDDFLKISEREILTHPEKARAEFEKYRQQLLLEKSPVERDFEATLKQVKSLEREGKARRPRGAAARSG